MTKLVNCYAHSETISPFPQLAQQLHSIVSILWALSFIYGEMQTGDQALPDGIVAHVNALMLYHFQVGYTLWAISAVSAP